jgi:hypothetical protein
MTSSSFRCKTAVLVLGILLATPLMSAAAPQAQPAPHTAGAFGALFTHLWATLTVLWGDAGCSADPYGLCGGRTAANPPVAPDNGCSFDPYGGCAETGSASPSSGATLDNGCSADPFGRCTGGS